MEKVKEYKNGDYHVIFTSLGSRIIIPTKENGKFDFPNGIDICITKECDNGCPFCYNNSTRSGKHSSFELFKKLLSTYNGGEIAIGGGDAFNHPDIDDMLNFCKEKGIFVSMTVNQNHLKRHKDKILRYFKEDLLECIGISLIDPSTWDEDLYQEINNAKEEGVTIHTIAGILDNTFYRVLKDKKLLILGYKDLGRGKGNMPTWNIEWLKGEGLDILQYKCKKIIFDNLAIDQLEIKNRFAEEDWDIIYQGDDGVGSMYLDLVDLWYGKSSIIDEKEEIPLVIDESTTIESLYKSML